jgi:hypothetical protein
MEQKLFRNPAADFAPMKNESVIFQSRTNKFCMLNGTATFIWNRLEQPRTMSELANMLCQHYDGVSFAEAARDVEKAVQQLLSLDCLSSSHGEKRQDSTHS